MGILNSLSQSDKKQMRSKSKSYIQLQMVWSYFCQSYAMTECIIFFKAPKRINRCAGQMGPRFGSQAMIEKDLFLLFELLRQSIEAAVDYFHISIQKLASIFYDIPYVLDRTTKIAFFLLLQTQQKFTRCQPYYNYSIYSTCKPPGLAKWSN